MNARLLNDNEKINLTADDLFDRVINLKFVTGYANSDDSVKNEFYIRSDYEIVYPHQSVTSVLQANNIATSEYYIRKCRHKPSIKVQFKNVGNGTSIGIKIFLSNFFMTTSDGQQLMNFNNDTYPIRSVEILMGYWGQFKRYEHKDWRKLNKENFNSKYGTTHLVCGVQYVTTEKLPPDYDLCIHAWIGENPYGTSRTADTKLVTYSDFRRTGSVQVSTSATSLENILFENITQRFTRLSTDSDRLKGLNQILSVADAKRYGIRVYVSEEARNFSKEVLEKKKEDSSGQGKKKYLSFEVGVTPENTLINLLSLIDERLKYKRLYSGDFIVCMSSEVDDLPSLFDSINRVNGNILEHSSVANEGFNHNLPAVYNINVDTLATIVAPFFYAVDTFDYVVFESRYVMSDLVAYYALGEGVRMNTFFVINQSVSFATVEDVNEMTLVCQGSLRGIRK